MLPLLPGKILFSLVAPKAEPLVAFRRKFTNDIVTIR
jgi:hypothetical protein